MSAAPPDEAAAAPPLSADPTIERIELGRALQRERARWQLLAGTLLVAALGVAQVITELAVLAIPLTLAGAALGVLVDRYWNASADEERMTRDLVAMTSIYYQSPLTIRRWLSDDFINNSIRNLLAASLRSEELGHGYFEQAVEPFVKHSEQGYKTGWRYQIDIAAVGAPVELALGGGTICTLSDATHRRLHTTVTYAQQAPVAAEMYYVACLFDPDELPSWFKRDNFLLREVAAMPAELIEAFAGRPRSPLHLPTRWEDVEADHRKDGWGGPEHALAERLLQAHAWIGEEQLLPEALYIDRAGVSWGLRLRDRHIAALRQGTQVRVELETFMARTQTYFPVAIAAPTRNPMVQFNYGLSDIENVETEVFFSAERPFDTRLRTMHEEYKRVDVLTEHDDWVFAGSGCVFLWDRSI